LLVRPALRFLHLYVVRKGFLDGLPGLQVCMLTAFFNTFMKQARLWEMEHALPQPDAEAEHVLSLSARQAPTVFGLLAAEQAPRRRESVRRGLAASRGAAQRDEPETHVAPGTTGDGWRKRRAAA
jgi:hypothetical protein